MVKPGLMLWVYLSPHLDDVALSCGGLVWEQAQAHETVSVWTICAGDPPAGALSDFAQALHTRWETSAQAPEERRLEDQAACRAMGADWRHFGLPDCIYRPGGESGLFYYDTEQALFGEIHPGEQPLVDWLAEKLCQELPGDAQVVCPLAIGGHVDHRLARRAAEQMKRPIWYYADYPYVIRSADPFQEMMQAGWTSQVFPVSQAGFTAWLEAIAAYSSQLSTFWADPAEMEAAMRDYWQSNSGVRLWQPVA